VICPTITSKSMRNTGLEGCVLSGANCIQVAIGVVKNANGQILLALRPPSRHQGGAWEFPGGKLEAGESSYQALRRELNEEVGIVLNSAKPLINITHHYRNGAVQLNAFLVEDFSGNAEGLEGQVVTWVSPEDLKRFSFPAANRPIITAAQLPEYYAILDDAPESKLLANLQKILAKGVKLIQARLKNLSAHALANFLAEAYPLCQAYQAWLLVNSAAAWGLHAQADGVHLTSRHLLALQERPKACRWVAASCHNLEELFHAQKIGVDFAVLAPVSVTRTHPDTPPLGWQKFADWVRPIALPVYALGGMALTDLDTVRLAGGQGIAAIRAFLA